MEGAMAESRYHVPNLDRALDILELLAKTPAGMNRAEIADAIGLSTNMVYRISMTLSDRGYLFRDETDKRYRLAPKMLELCRSSLDDYSLAARGWDDMVALRDELGETVHLGVLSGQEGVVIERVLGNQPVCVLVERGLSFDLHASAPGKVLLAGLSNGCRKKLLKQLPCPMYTETTIGKTALPAVIDQAAAQGYATDLGERFQGINCVAAPVCNAGGETVASLCVTGPASRIEAGHSAEVAAVVKEHAARISHRLGYR
jgi:DNA-binding IclR family transcriptional regulator